MILFVADISMDVAQLIGVCAVVDRATRKMHHGSCSVVHKPHDTILQKASLIGEDAVKLQNSSQAASAQ